jgi:hypothetical protein
MQPSMMFHLLLGLAQVKLQLSITLQLLIFPHQQELFLFEHLEFPPLTLLKFTLFIQ